MEKCCRPNFSQQCCERSSGIVASEVRGLAGVTVLCSRPTHFTLTLALHPGI